MAFVQKSTPPPNKILNFSYRDFSGGLNNRSDQLQDNEASSILNLDFADDTLFEKRKGQTYFDEFITETPIIYIDEYKPYQNTNLLIRATESKVYIEDQLLANVAGKINGVNHSGKYIFCDGSKLYIYGLFAQEASTYVNIIGTPINNNVLLEIVSPADGHPRLDITHVQGVYNIDYTNSKIYYEPCENEFTDTYSGANKVPENINYLVSHNGRIFASGNDKDNDNVFISDVRNPFYFPVSLPIQLPPNSDKIVGMVVYDNSVVVGRQNDLYAILGNTNRTDMGVDPFQLKRINTHTGFANNDSIDVAHNYLFYLGYDGNMYSLGSTRADEKQLVTTILSQQIDLVKEPIGVNINDLSGANSVFFRDMWYLNIEDVTLIYSYRHRAWTMFKKLNSKFMYVLNNQLIWSNESGRVIKFSDTVYLDFGEPYEAHWYSKFFDMDTANNFKQFREFFLVAHAYEDYASDINVLFEVDYTDLKERIIVSNQIAVWGKSIWGDRFVTRNISESVPFVLGRRGRNIRIKISCGEYVHGEVATQADLITYLGRRNGILVKTLDENKYFLYMNGNWTEIPYTLLNQRMKIYQINGDYELRGKR